MGSVSSTSRRCTSAAFGPGLVRDQRHAENLFGDLRRFVGVLRDLDAAAFAAPTRMNLRFHNDAPAEFLRSRSRLRRR